MNKPIAIPIAISIAISIANIALPVEDTGISQVEKEISSQDQEQTDILIAIAIAIEIAIGIAIEENYRKSYPFKAKSDPD